MTANILPKLSADFHNAMIIEKDYQKGLEIYKKLYPVVNMTERYPAPTQAVKHILTEVIGFDEESAAAHVVKSVRKIKLWL